MDFWCDSTSALFRTEASLPGAKGATSAACLGEYMLCCSSGAVLNGTLAFRARRLQLRHNGRMRIGKPLLLIATPIGVAIGLYEAWRLAGGLVFLMFAMLCVLGAAAGSIIMTVRREKREERERHPPPPT